jgi:membrane protease YdiL (CAAX protease family)
MGVAVAVFARAGQPRPRTIVAALRGLGLRAPAPGQWRVAFTAIVPIVIAYSIVFAVLHVPSDLQQPFAARIFKYAVAQGVAEEVVFRGLAFQLLRRGRSFGRAALLSAGLFAAVHVTNLLNGWSAEVMIGAALSAAYAFVMAFPLALLFERGGRSIAGCAVVHFAIDSNSWFAKLGDSGAALLVYMGIGALGSLAVVTSLTKRWLPSDAAAPRS